METKTVEKNGRKYEAVVDGKMEIIIGPPEGLVDELGLPEPFATRLHNALHARGFHNYGLLNSKGLIGALMETLMVDAQRLNEIYFKFHQEAQND
jgi:hypothetical protein